MFYTHVFLQIVVGDMFEKYQDLGLFSVLCAINSKISFYKLLF